MHSLQHDDLVSHVNTVHCPVYVSYNEEKQNILLPTTTDMSCKENAKLLYDEVSNLNLHANPYFGDPCHDIETFSYMHYDRSNQVMVQAVYIGNYMPVCADIKGEPFSMINYDSEGNLKGLYDNTYTIPMYVNNGTTVNLMPTHYYETATFLHHLPEHDATGETIQTGNGTIQCHFWMDVAINIQGCLLRSVWTIQ